jgi:hypothetical protein
MGRISIGINGVPPRPEWRARGAILGVEAVASNLTGFSDRCE